MIHDGMPYDPMHGQGLKCAKISAFNGNLLRQYVCNQQTNGEL